LHESLEYLLRREQREARRGELERQRHAIQPQRDLGQDRRIALIEAEIRASGLRLLKCLQHGTLLAGKLP